MLTGEKCFQRKRFGCTLHKLHGFAHRRHFHRKEFIKAGIIQPFDEFGFLSKLFGARFKAHQMILTKIKHAAERLSHADRPGNRHALQLEHGFDFAEQIQRVAHFTIKLVDERDDRRVAHAADIQKLDRLSFDALGRVNDHDGGVHGRENTIRILGEVLVARRVEQIDDVILVFELHHGTRYRDAALLFHFHPVACGMARSLAPLDSTGHLNGAAEEQQFFRQGRFTRVRVRNNGKSATTAHFS